MSHQTIESPTDPRIKDSRVVVLCGISGSGKTTLAKKLEREGYIRLSADGLIGEKYGAQFHTFSMEKRAEIFQGIDIELAGRLQELLAQGHKVVVDSTMCKRFKRDMIRQKCREADASFQIVFLQASFDVLKQRLASRTGADPDQQVITLEQLQTFFRNFERPSADEDCLIISQN